MPKWLEEEYRMPHQLRNENNKVVTPPDELKTEWSYSVENLFQDERGCSLSNKSQVKYTLRNMKTGKPLDGTRPHPYRNVVKEENLKNLIFIPLYKQETQKYSQSTN